MATHILDKGGVVRGFSSLGHDQELPYRMRKHQNIYNRGSIYSMIFDAGPSLLPSIKQQLSFDEDVLRATIIKMGDSIGKVSSYTPPEKL